jgi:hypothetical protein
MIEQHESGVNSGAQDRSFMFFGLSNLSIMSVSDEGYSEARRAH